MIRGGAGPVSLKIIDLIPSRLEGRGSSVTRRPLHLAQTLPRPVPEDGGREPWEPDSLLGTFV